MTKITIYSTTRCQYCQMLKNYLRRKNIEFEEKQVDKDPVAFEEMNSLSDGFGGVPFTVIRSNSGKTIKVLGYDKDKIDKALDLYY